MSDVTYICPECGKDLKTEVLEVDKEGQKQLILHSCPEHGERVIIQWDE